MTRQILAESAERIQTWRSRILDAVGPNGRLIVDLIPQMGLIMGPQPPVSQLSPYQAQRRLSLVFQRFVSALADASQPLVIFLDDLQWIDSASVQLLTLLVGQPDVHHLLFIGAYRDNEVHGAHPLVSMLDELRRLAVRINTVVLKPLTVRHVAEILTAALEAARTRWRRWPNSYTASRGGIRFSRFNSWRPFIKIDTYASTPF